MPSAVVHHMEYNVDTHTLRVRFVSGLVYDYKNVPENIYNAMKSSFSKGTFLNENIKGHYEFTKVS